MIGITKRSYVNSTRMQTFILISEWIGVKKGYQMMNQQKNDDERDVVLK
jgi:hypothetical protein